MGTVDSKMPGVREKRMGGTCRSYPLEVLRCMFYLGRQFRAGTTNFGFRPPGLRAQLRFLAV